MGQRNQWFANATYTKSIRRRWWWWWWWRRRRRRRRRETRKVENEKVEEGNRGGTSIDAGVQVLAA